MISEHRFLGKHSQLMTTFEKEQWFWGMRLFSNNRNPFAWPVIKPNNGLMTGRNNLSQKTSY